VELSGGEPTLEPGLVRRCIEYVRAAAPPGVTVDCSLATNGILLDDNLLAFLVDHDVSLDVSFDGVAAAQDLRGASTFAVLDALLTRARTHHPRYFEQRVSIRMVVERRTLPLLAESVRYFLGRAVRRIAVAPCLTPDSGSGLAEEETLCDQLDVIVADSLRHLETTGTVPVGFLAGADGDPRGRGKGPRCAAVSGRCACVDASGLVWGCPLFARSLRKLPPLAALVADFVFLGGVHDSSLTPRLAALPARTRHHPLFSARSRRCGSRQCCDCEFAADCRICPAAICERSHNPDPREVPTFHCAFSRVTLDARRRFRDMRAKAGTQQCPAELAEALRDVATALQAQVSGMPESGSGRS
jgi:sulfatase maturation enzyme AslB (radical SAM superfamily)